MPSTLNPSLETDAEACQFIIDFTYERCGVRLHTGKEALISARLGKRIRLHGFAGLPEYCQFLRDRATEDELVHVVDALTTNFTSFLRESDHFDFLVQSALPSLLKRNERRFRIWSAACSSGEEPYTLAFYLFEHFAPAGGWDWKITASDISTKVLEQARRGVYGEDRTQTVPPLWLRKYFQRGIGNAKGQFRVAPFVAGRIDFRQINLVTDYTQPHPFEIILCRNVMIYFDRPTQEKLVNQLCRYLVPNGYLIIGHSESLSGLRIPLRCLRPSIYQKT